MKKVYVAGKLNDNAVNYIKNLHNMIKTANEIRRLGFSVYIPCLDILAGLIDGTMEYDDYFNNSQPWLEAADAVFILPDSLQSKGTQAEIAHAKTLGIPVIYGLKSLFTINTEGNMSAKEEALKQVDGQNRLDWVELKKQGSAHYKTDGGVEPIDLYRAGNMFRHFALCSIIKYAFRNRDVEEPVSMRDMDKICDYAQKLKAACGE